MLNEKIKDLRMARGISQVQFASALGVTKQCVSNWENDNIMPSVEMLKKIAAFFHVSCDYVLGITSQKTIDVSKLNDEEIAHINFIVDSMSKSR